MGERNTLDRPDLDFTEEEVRDITRDIETLASTPEWETYARVVKEMVNAGRAQGFADRDKIDYWAGFVDGLLYVWGIRAEMQAQMKRLLAQEEAEGEGTRKAREEYVRRQRVFDNGDLSL